MPSIEEFLSTNKELETTEEESANRADGISIAASITGISPSRVDFQHMGASFSAARGDVLEIITSEQTISSVSAGGKQAIIVFRADALIRRQAVMSISDLVANIPFALAQPTTQVQPAPPSAVEEAWKLRMGYAPPPLASVPTSALPGVYLGSYSSTQTRCSHPPIFDDTEADRYD